MGERGRRHSAMANPKKRGHAVLNRLKLGAQAASNQMQHLARSNAFKDAIWWGAVGGVVVTCVALTAGSHGVLAPVCVVIAPMVELARQKTQRT
jgi:hypothetical protein